MVIKKYPSALRQNVDRSYDSEIRRRSRRSTGRAGSASKAAPRRFSGSSSTGPEKLADNGANLWSTKENTEPRCAL